LLVGSEKSVLALSTTRISTPFDRNLPPARKDAREMNIPVGFPGKYKHINSDQLDGRIR
jgi:hypothetical protein